MTPDSGYPDESARSTGSSTIPTSVPTSFYGQAQGDMLNQQIQADAASSDFQSQLIQDHVASQNDIASVKQLDQAMQPVRNANQYIGSNAWGSGHNTYCETFAEQMTDGKNEGGSAAEAFNNRLQSGQAVADPSLQGVSPGDLVYFGGAQENGGYGHVGVYAGNGRIISATVNGIQNYPISAFHAPVSGYAKTGGGGGGMGTIGENTGGGSGVNMNVPQMPHENKTEGGDNPPPPQFSGGSWAPPSADAFKDWFGAQVSKIFNAPPDAGNIAGQQMSDLGSKANEVAGDVGDALNDPNGMEKMQQGLKSAGGAVLGKALDVGLAQAPLTDEERQGVTDTADSAVSNFADQNMAAARQRIADITSGDPARGVPAVNDVLLSTVGGKGELPESAPLTDMASEPGPVSDALGVIKKAVLSRFDPAALTPPSMQDRIAQYANDLLGANQQGETMARNVRDLHPNLDIGDAINYERTGNLLEDMTPEEQAKNDAIKARIDSAGDMLKQRGLVTEDVTQPGADLGQTYLPGMAPNGPANYFPHLLANDSSYEDVVGRGSLTPQDYFSRQREFPDLAQASAAGYDLKGPVDQVLGEHIASAEKAAARQDFLTGIKDDTAVAQPLADAPRDWVRGGKLDPLLHGYAIEPNSARAINNLLTTPSSNWLDSVNSSLKESNLALSGFHAATMAHQTWRVAVESGNPAQAVPILAQGLHNLISDKAYQSFYMAHPEMFEDAADTGTTMLARGRSPDVGPMGLGSGGQMLARALIGGATGGLTANATAQKVDPQNVGRDTLAGVVAGAGANVALTPAMNEALFGRFIPTLKVMSHDMASDAFGQEAASKLVNDAFGGQNLTAIARDPGFQRLLHATVLAPDWMESWIRMAGRSFTGGASGEAARKYWTTTLTSAILGLEATNYALTGHLTVPSPLGPGNESGREMQLDLTPVFSALNAKGVPGTDVGGQHVYIDPLSLGPVTSLESAIRNRDPGSFASGRLSVPLKIGGSLWANEDYKGAHIVPPGTPAQEAFPRLAAYGVAQDVPIGENTLANGKQSPGEKLINILTGMRTGRGPATPQSVGGGGYRAPSGGYRSGYSGYRTPRP